MSDKLKINEFKNELIAVCEKYNLEINADYYEFQNNGEVLCITRLRKHDPMNALKYAVDCTDY